MTAQTELLTGDQLRDQGMTRAIDHANQVHANWSEDAYAFLIVFVATHKDEFMCEDMRSSSEGIVPEPPSKRAWGAVVAKAAKSGLIKRKGFRSVSNAKAHSANASVWQRSI